MKMKKRLLSILLSLALILGLMPGLSLTAYADDDPPYAQYKNTKTVITFDGKFWYLINYDANTVTLLAKECVGASMYNSGTSFVKYSQSTVKTAVDNWYDKKITADAKKAVSGGAMFLLTIEQAKAITNAEVRKCSNATKGAWWLCSQGDTAGTRAAFVYGGSGDVDAYGDDVGNTLGVRPALKLNLSSVIFSSESKTFVLKQTIAAENVTVTYGDTDKKVSASVTKPATSGGAISYTVKTGSEDFIAVDSTTGALTIKKVPSDGRAYVIVTAAESGNYGKTTKEVTVTINKANVAPATVTANNCTYDGAEKPLVTVTGTASGGTMQYALGTKDAATQPYTTSIPTATNAGTYHVWYKAVGDANHTDSAANCVTVTIKEKAESGNGGSETSKSNETEAPQQSGDGSGNNNSSSTDSTTEPATATPETTAPTAPGTTAPKTAVEQPTSQQERITIPKTPVLKKLKAKKNKVTVTWNKIKKNKAGKKLLKQIQYIQIQVATDSEFKDIATTRNVGKKKTKATLMKLQRKTTYYVRVRYVGADGVPNWSKVKRIRTK